MKKRIVIFALGLLLCAAAALAAGGNLGTMTAGSISGVTAVFGSGGEVTLNSSGISITGGTATQNKIKWSDGTIVRSNGSGYLDAYANANITLWANQGSGGDILTWTGFALDGGATELGTNTRRWSKLYAANARFTTLAGAGSNRFVCNDNNGDIYTSGTTCDGSAPAAAQIAALEKELAELRGVVQQLAASEQQQR
jgi:hypothetical protein